MSLETQVEGIRAEAGFDAVLIADLKGKIVAVARADDTSPEMLEALLDMATRIATRPEDREALADTGESSFFDWEGRQIVCRRFEAHGPRLLIMLSAKRKPHKRAAARLIKAAQNVLGS